MAGKFTNTQYGQTVDNLVGSMTNKLNNPYYKFNDKKPTTVIYYKINKEMTTLDEASKLNYQFVGSRSPIYYNRIDNFLLYGIERISLDFDVGEYGLENPPITGTAIVLPNTIEPTDGDFFLIKQIKERGLLFKVNKVTPDTLDTGSNIYQIDYQLELTEAVDNIEKQVVKRYNFIAGNVGTEFKTTFTEEETKVLINYEALTEELIRFYNALFFDDKLQTFVYLYNGLHIYDPYLIQFIINNKIFCFGDEYIYVDHATALNQLFPIEYAKSIFYQLEHKEYSVDFDDLVYLEKIIDPNSLFLTRMDDYYEVKCGRSPAYRSKFNPISDVFTSSLRSREYISGEFSELYNFIISYFNDEENKYIGAFYDKIKTLDWLPSNILFYIIPICIYVLQKYINKLML